MDLPAGRRKRYIAWKNLRDKKVSELRESETKSNTITFTFDDLLDIYGPDYSRAGEEL